MSHTWILDKVGCLFVNRAYPWVGRRLDRRSPRRTPLQPYGRGQRPRLEHHAVKIIRKATSIARAS
jgi:hypothetical protein